MQSIAMRRSQVLENIEVRFDDVGKRILATSDTSLLELAEENNLEIEAGCLDGCMWGRSGSNSGGNG